MEKTTKYKRRADLIHIESTISRINLNNNPYQYHLASTFAVLLASNDNALQTVQYIKKRTIQAGKVVSMSGYSSTYRSSIMKSRVHLARACHARRRRQFRAPVGHARTDSLRKKIKVSPMKFACPVRT
jgi:hypothetical protein